MTPRIHSTTTRIGPAAYDAWRRTPLGALTERLEYGLVFETAGRLDGLRVLDVGSGDGMFAIKAAQRGAAATGVDPDPATLAAAADRARAMGVSLRLGGGRAEQLPFADGTFDMVISIAVLCFVADADAAIREMARVLRPGGRLILGELNRWSSWAAIRYAKGLAGSRTWRRARFRTAAQLRRSVSAAGLSVVSVNGAVFYPPLAAAARLLAPWDRWLGRRTTFGAALVVVAAVAAVPGREEQVIGLHEHGRELQPITRPRREAERPAGNEHADGREALHGGDLVEHRLEVAIFGKPLQRHAGAGPTREQHIAGGRDDTYARLWIGYFIRKSSSVKREPQIDLRTFLRRPLSVPCRGEDTTDRLWFRCLYRPAHSHASGMNRVGIAAPGVAREPLPDRSHCVPRS